MLLTALLLSTAQAAPLHSGELYDTAHTTPQGTYTIRILNPSSYAVSDQFQLKTSLLGLIGGPNVIAEYNLMKSKESALSMEVNGGSNWNFNGYSAGGGLNYTIGGTKANRVNFSGGLGYAGAAGAGSLSVPIGASYHIVPNDQVVIQFFGQTNVMSFTGENSVPSGVAGFKWNKGWDKFRLALGLNLYIGGLGNALDALEATGYDTSNLPNTIVIPLPTVGFWWRV